MTYSSYWQHLNSIVDHPAPAAPYDNEMYMNYTRLNRSRMKRWDKQLVLDQSVINVLQQVTTPQHWIIISEPWCGDAAHVLPFLVRMAETNSLISYEIQLRDSEPFLINQYLTNGGKSIPKLVARNEKQEDLFTWGPRPAGAAKIYEDMRSVNADLETMRIALQNWYNLDKGLEIGREIADLLVFAEPALALANSK